MGRGLPPSFLTSKALTWSDSQTDLGGRVASLLSSLSLPPLPPLPLAFSPFCLATVRLLGFKLVGALLTAEMAVSKVGLHTGFVLHTFRTFWFRCCVVFG